MSWTWGANSSFTELTFLRRVCFSPRPSGRFRPIKGFGRVDESTAGGGPCGRFIPYLPYLSTVDTDEMMRAVLEFLRTARELAPIKVQRPWGTVYRDDRFPLIHQANLAWVSAVPDDGPEPILADMDQAFRGTAIRHRALLFEDAERAHAVQEEFIRRGLRPTAELAMAKVGLPDFRMQGVGRTMIFEACKRAAEARCEWVVLISDLFDTPQEMYKTLGFEPIGEVRGFLRESG